MLSFMKKYSSSWISKVDRLHPKQMTPARLVPKRTLVESGGSFDHPESADLIQAIQMGQIDQVPPHFVKRCTHCKNVLKSLIEDKSDISDLPVVCSVRELWLTAWKMNHDCLNLSEQVSLDSSSDDCTDDQLRHQLEEELAAEFSHQEVKCGLHCCTE
eukprot:gene3733-4082_t